MKHVLLIVSTLFAVLSSLAQEQQLTIHYSPSGALVLIDSKLYQGQNGTVIATLSVGEHKVIVAADGYESFECSVILNATAPSSIKTNLVESQGEKIKDRSVTNGQSAAQLPTNTYKSAVETFTVDGVSFKMNRVDGGMLMMGATKEQGTIAPYDNEKPVHQVTLSTYMIGETEVTQALWQAVMGRNPSKYKGDNLPVENVSWDDCQEFIQQLNAVTGRQFRLPTEAEWEFAARGGNKSNETRYSGSDKLEKVSWNDKNSDGRMHEVKTKSPNKLRLYDMSGNVYEWCQDWFGLYSSDSQTNPQGPSQGRNRVIRGGCYSGDTWNCRVSYRESVPPGYRDVGLGLRLAL